MEVVAASPSSAGSGTMPPYQRRDVEEWSHLDRLTGMLEHARVETDHWAANTHNSQHKYGKVVDSRDRCAPDGSQQQRQRRQLEVFQAHVPGGSLQVIRTQTVATSSSRWSSASSTQTTAASAQQTNASSLQGFENLQLALNPLDLSSQKTKASVGRSGSIGGRRPPSRPRSLIGRRAEPDAAVSARLQRVSRLCQQLHNETITGATNTSKPSILERQNGDGSVSSDHFENSESPKNNIEPFWNKTNDSETTDWKKSSEFTPSRNTANHLQLTNSASKINKNHPDAEATDRRLNTALRGNSVDLEALDQILKSISSSTSNYSDKISVSDDFKSDEQPEKDDADQLKETKSKKRHSFITVESLQEVRGRLRRLSSPIDGYNSIEYAKEEEPDDGIADAEDTLTKKEETIMPASNTGVSRVRSYVYGMEAMLHNKKPIIGTGSLESRTSSKSNGVSTNRSEDWYNRRKSYGFEQVHNQQIDQTNSISLRGKNKIESSTDSGICRSTEIVVVPSVLKPQYNKFNSSKVDSQQITTSYGKVGNSTVINLNGDNNKTPSVLSTNFDNLYKQNNELFNVWNRRALFNAEENSNQINKKDSEQTTITIPIVAEENNDTNNRRMYHRQMSDGSSMSIESSWPKNKSDNQEIKRHSIAVDESKYVTNNRYAFNQDKRTSLAAGESLMKDEIQHNDQDQEDSNTNLNRKQKKVEFCKTEVHFAAESGRVNIVETDEKPPPTQNFRRRRRNSSVTSNHVPENYNKTGLPIIHFGDTTYEKKLFGVSDQEAANLNEDIYNKDTSFASMIQENANNVTISSVSINQDYEPEREVQENESLPRGILKNKMIKPKPYILGDENNELLAKETSNEDQDSLIWGVRLKPVHKQEENSQPTSTPLWRSTVTVQNTSYNNSINKRESVLEDNDHQTTSNTQPEFQKLLYSLRPARKSEPSIMTPEAPIEKRSTAIDLRRSSWSVADRIKQVEDLKQENKGYSTRVNFGSGETTVVENGDIEKHTTWPRQEELHATDISSIKSSFSSNIQKNQNVSSHYDKQRGPDAKVTSISVREPLARKHSDSSVTESPKVGRKINNIKRNFEANRSTYSNGYLSSPSLVETSVQKPTVSEQTKSNKSEAIEKKFQVTEERINTFSNKVSSITSKESPNTKRKTFNRKASPIVSQYSYTKQNVPKKLEPSRNFEEPKATNFNQSGKPNKSWFDNRPDLLKNHDTAKAYVNLSTVIKEENKSTPATNTSKIADIRKVSPTKTRPDSPSINRPESPIYENIDEVISNLNAMERESCMLQELTKAADQILQAVNGYTDEDSKVSTDSEDDGKKHRLKLRNTGELSTISETKSWKQVQNKSTKLISKNLKSRVRATSSTSSIESLTKETKPIPPVRLNRAAKLNEERTKKKITGSNSELSKIIKTRRLQRASSREALLQSHGSSSEDIAINTDIRKPTRLVRKTKTGTEDVCRKSSVSQTNSITTTKKKDYDGRRYSDRVPVVGLQEIRHKTAISTIKSTAEKAASREKAMKAKAEELKKRTTGKRDTTSSKGSNTVSSHHGTTSTHRSSTSGQYRGDVGSSGAAGSHGRQELSAAAVRTSSGVIRKHSRTEGLTKS